MAAHRADRTLRPLGIDRLAAQHKLTDEEQIVLLTVYCVALSEDPAAFCFDALGSGMVGIGSPEFWLRFLEATSTADRVRCRSIFAANGRLLKSGLVHLDYRRAGDLMPEDLLWARVQITQGAFDIISGVGPVLNVVEAEG